MPPLVKTFNLLWEGAGKSFSAGGPELGSMV